LHDSYGLRGAAYLLIMALFTQAECSDGDQALNIYTETSHECREALSVTSIEQNPEDWAAIQGIFLGDSLCHQAERESGRDAMLSLDAATTAYKESLRGYQMAQKLS